MTAPSSNPARLSPLRAQAGDRATSSRPGRLVQQPSGRWLQTPAAGGGAASVSLRGAKKAKVWCADRPVVPAPVASILALPLSLTFLPVNRRGRAPRRFSPLSGGPVARSARRVRCSAPCRKAGIAQGFLSAAWLRTSPAGNPPIGRGTRGRQKKRKDSAGPALNSSLRGKLSRALCAVLPELAGASCPGAFRGFG